MSKTTGRQKIREGGLVGKKVVQSASLGNAVFAIGRVSGLPRGSTPLRKISSSEMASRLESDRLPLMKRRWILAGACALVFFGVCLVHAADGELAQRDDVAYVNAADPQNPGRQELDLYLPKGVSSFPILVWFHGGGLTAGSKDDVKDIGLALARQGIGVAIPNYRLSPHVKYPVYIQDAAQAVAWVVQHAAELGVDPNRIFVGGHSAGAYLSAMLAMDPHYLKDAGISLDQIAGFIPVSGQMTTHFTVRGERGLPDTAIISDQAAPAYFTRKDTPPILFILGDKDWPARLEENYFFVAALRAAGNQNVSIETIPDRDHGSIVSRIPEPQDPVDNLIRTFIEKERAR